MCPEHNVKKQQHTTARSKVATAEYCSMDSLWIIIGDVFPFTMLGNILAGVVDGQATFTLLVRPLLGSITMKVSGGIDDDYIGAGDGILRPIGS